MERNNKRWITIAIIAAAIAAVTTLVVLALRARAKKKAWFEDAAFDYDADDCECFDICDDDFAEPAEEIEG